MVLFRPAALLPNGSGKRALATALVRPRTIRARLRRILLVSVAMVLGLLAIIISREVAAYRDTGSTVRAVTLALAVQNLVHEAQRERGLTNGLQGGDDSLRPVVEQQRAATDNALLALERAVAARPAGADQVRSALTHVAGLSANRADVDARRIDRSASFQFYTGAITALNQARPGLDKARDTELWHGLQALYALGDAKEYTGQERGFLHGVFAAGGFEPGEYVRFLDIRAAKQAAITAFDRDATPEQRALLIAAMRSEDAVGAGAAEAVAIASTAGPLLEPVSTADWWRQMTAVVDLEHEVQQSVAADIRARADTLRDRAALLLGGYVLAALLAVLALVALVVATVRSIVRPLARLASEADDVAGHRLPELIAAWHRDADADPAPPPPVRVSAGAGEEIVSVAQALDRVQTTAFDLASEQALLRRNTTESLANLGRRNQNLVRRQLGLISEFERAELDPTALSNLFELDHLATRMRRNAESLLVLVGEASPRRWSEPIPLSDVIRAGLSEVDDYRRVVLRRVDEIAVVGSAVSEVAHMLAELIENGLSFSPPDLEVEIYGRRTGQRYLIAIVDHGVGMPPDQLAIANARLRGEADFLVAPTRFLGHYVVGRLARRLGVQVELTISPVSGVVARLLLPPDLVVDQRAEQPALTAKDTAPQKISAPLTRESNGAAILPHVSEDSPAPVRQSGDAPGSADPAWPTPGRHHRPGPVASTTGHRSAPATNGAATCERQSFPLDHAPTDRTAGPSPVVEVTNPLPGNASRIEDEANGTEVQRTRNGLVKRNRKARGHTGAAESVHPAPTRQPSAALAQRSPDEVRGILAGFRAGHQRGASNTQEDRR
ncbi:Nitrate and nitrite sensing [Nocardia otitidiscaviarum]|uniref:histidine kinase n=1 Tax=Nocardia otitidiscaviarum TaxID=1823 RepID=A0A378YL54_9NOCA|nr:ATP-binding protein [Nocardia otitidiscaviarum]SUA77906.1 Nitrate and nitrite sensing [Nocardia otitidiscaviarum]